MTTCHNWAVYLTSCIPSSGLRMSPYLLHNWNASKKGHRALYCDTSPVLKPFLSASLFQGPPSVNCISGFYFGCVTLTSIGLHFCETYAPKIYGGNVSLRGWDSVADCSYSSWKPPTRLRQKCIDFPFIMMMHQLCLRFLLRLYSPTTLKLHTLIILTLGGSSPI